MFFAIIIARVLQYEVCVELCQKRQMEVQCKIKKMQTYFNEICIEQKMLMEKHQELCENEDEAYQHLMSSCQYFNEHNYIYTKRIFINTIY